MDNLIQDKAGQDLDVLVAEEVMEEVKPIYVPDWSQVMSAALEGNIHWSERGNWYWICEYDKGNVATCYPRPFSSDWRAAGRVIEKMRKDGWAYSLTDGAQDFHDCHFYKENNEQPDFYAIADTAPLAICLASLKALGAGLKHG